MRIGVLVFEQAENEIAQHFISKEMKAKFLAHRHNGKLAVRELGKQLLKIVVPLTFQKIKSLLKNFRDSLPKYSRGIPFIPDKLPSHKTPGTRAVGKVVEQNGYGRARIVLANMLAAGR